MIGKQIWEPATEDFVELRVSSTGDHELVIGFTNLAPESVRAAQAAPIQIGFIYAIGAIAVLYKTAIAEGFAPYSIHRASAKEVPAKDQPGRVSVLLIEAETGILRAARLVREAPKAFYETFHDALNSQLAVGFDERQFEETLAACRAAFDADRSGLWEVCHTVLQLDLDYAN